MSTPARANGAETDGAAAPDTPNGAGDGAPPPPVDRVFAEPVRRASDFKFDGRTASVFDDMLGRSVPFYDEIQRMTCELAGDFAAPGTSLYDLGCSTGTTLAALEPYVHPSVRFVGVDSSPEMLLKARQKLDGIPSPRQRDRGRARAVPRPLRELPLPLPRGALPGGRVPAAAGDAPGLA